MINAINTFTISGVVYEDPIKKPLKKNPLINSQFATKFIIACGINLKYDCRLQITAVRDCADKAYVLCRKGAYVCVKGFVVSKEIINKRTGDLDISIRLIATDVLPLIAPKPISISDFTFTSIVVATDPNRYSEMTPLEKGKENVKEQTLDRSDGSTNG